MQAPAGADVEGEALGGAPVVLHEVFLNVVARTEDGGLEVDGEGIDLPEQEAGKGVAAGGGCRSRGLGVRAGGGKGKGTRWG